MSIEFEDKNGQGGTMYAQMQQMRPVEGLLGWIMKVTGADEKKANIYLAIIFLVIAGTTTYLFWSALSEPVRKPQIKKVAPKTIVK